MGRKIRWAYYSLKRLLFWLAVAWVGMYVFDSVSVRYDADVGARAQTVILPQVREIDAAGMAQFLSVPRATTLIFVYDSNNLLSRWYFDDFNRMAAIYAPSGARFLFVSVDVDVQEMANFLASRGDLYFPLLHMSATEAAKIPGVVKALGGDPSGGMLPYMGVLNGSQYLRDFSPAIVRTGKIEELLNQALRGS